MKPITFPDGTRVNADGVATYVASGSNVSVIMLGGATYTYNAGTAANANVVVAALDGFYASGLSATTFTAPVVPPPPPVVTGISPSTVAANSQQLMTVTGTGFQPGARVTVNQVGQYDSYLTTFIDPNTITFILPSAWNTQTTQGTGGPQPQVAAQPQTSYIIIVINPDGQAGFGPTFYET